ncbi:MAG: hypothetical protein WKF40_05245 [Thermoleophilaceae bacterium]
MTLMVPALLANDAQRQGLERTLWGAGISTLAVYGSLNLVTAGLTATGALWSADLAFAGEPRPGP